MDNLIAQILEAWRTNNRVNLYLIDRISDEGMKCTLSKRGGRNVVRQFAHLHSDRVWHLQNRAKDLSLGLRVFETHEEPDKETLKEHLSASSERIEAYLERGVTGTGKCRCFKKGIIATFGYLIAHESHHRGSILLTLKECGHNLDQQTRFAIWNWEKI